jgi:ADP-ribosyl-[dinitrogen reductase] hydrolase
MNMYKNAIHVIIGQAVGDALGSTYEFEDEASAQKMIQEDMDENGHLPMVGKGAFKLVPGQITDDTAQALALGRSIIRKGRYDPENVCMSYQAWLASEGCFGIGKTTLRALRVFKPYKDTVAHSAKVNGWSLANGCLMRISSYAIYSAGLDDEERIKREVAMDVKIMHPNDLLTDITTVYVFMIRELIRAPEDEVNTVRIKRAFDKGLSMAEDPITLSLMRDAVYKQTPLFNGERIRVDGKFQGLIHIAFQNAVYQMLHADDFEKAMVSTINMGGDTDTCGAIAGALIGSYLPIPLDWVECVLKCKNKRDEQYPPGRQHDLSKVAVMLLKTGEASNNKKGWGEEEE